MDSFTPRVSSRCGEALLELARLAKMDTRPLVDGLPFDEQTLRTAGWIAWDDYCTMVERVESAAGGPEAIEQRRRGALLREHQQSAQDLKRSLPERDEQVSELERALSNQLVVAHPRPRTTRAFAGPRTRRSRLPSSERAHLDWARARRRDNFGRLKSQAPADAYPSSRTPAAEAATSALRTRARR